eukprot:TRINITY_DN4376_c0_g3_i1.p1 TRINITY_DN4376_c0_g3~~TRINITY_DN4376_c0_g3_i1.p1  ORF type:complete len:486 (+),score=128.09 TRINITY_DN4376_c0_g3_i1:122-1579(+)
MEQVIAYIPAEGREVVNHILTDFWAQLQRNDLLSAGLVIGFLGTMLAFLRSMFRWIRSSIEGWCTTTLEINSHEDAYDWVRAFFARRQPNRGDQFTVMVKSSEGYYDDEGDYVEPDITESDVHLVPNCGRYRIWYEGVPVWFTLNRKTGKIPTQWLDSIVIQKLGRDSTLLRNLCREAYRESQTRDQEQTVIYRADDANSRWRRLSERRIRPFESVVLDEGLAESLLADVERFMSRGEWYQARGIPYRRGFLLYGPPGCGKTSFISALAGKLHCKVCILNLASRLMNDAVLADLFCSLPERSLVLLEDVDAVFAGTQSGADNRVSFSGLLNAIDGVAAQEGSMLFMTTNYIERLAPALIRPGRVDKRILFDLAGNRQLRLLFTTFFPEASEALLNEFLALVPERVVSMAQLQAHFLAHCDDAREAVAHAKDMLAAAYEQKMQAMNVDGAKANDKDIVAAIVDAQQDGGPAAAAAAVVADEGAVSA